MRFKMSSPTVIFVVIFSVILIFIKNAECLSVVSRSEWGASAPAIPLKNLRVNPPSHVVIHHSVSTSCLTKQKCMQQVKSFQVDHIKNRQFDDIGYNFLIGEDGNIYEGRGWGKHGAHATILNSKSIGICMIGTFTNKTPNTAALNALKELISYGVENSKISASYKLVGHRQIKSTQCPGNALYNAVKEMEHYSGTL